MNIPSRIKNILRKKQLPWPALLVLLSALFLSACDSVPNEPTVTGGSGGGSSAAAYTGESCNSVATGTDNVEDVCNFQTEFWANMLSAGECENCHTTDPEASRNQTPFFMDTIDINTAYGQMTNPSNLLVDRANPANSKVIAMINANHNCGGASACSVLATNATNYITYWVNGGRAGSGQGDQTNDIALVPPTIKDTGSSKNFPEGAAPAGFTEVHDLLTLYCANCHTDSASVPQTPFFAVTSVNDAYDAIVSSQKINLGTPGESRLVARMDEGHNCWDLTSTSQRALAESRKNCAIEMQEKIEAFAGTIPTTAVEEDWVISKALTLLDGTVASGGARDDSSTIALYQFKAGAGATVQDSSGAGVPLDLRLFGTEGTDYRWVGGWGIEFLTSDAKAQATTQDSRKLLTQILGSSAYSIEAWLVPANISQGDNNPARIINYSGGSNERNFTLGQAEYRYAFMNRSSAEPSANGNTLLTDDDDEDLQATQQHVVVTFDLATGRKVYVNGVDVSTVGNDMGSTDPLNPAGNLVNWDPSYAFSMGNEADFSEPWKGKLRLVAIHNRAITPTQIQQNFEAGVGQKFYLLFSVSDKMNDPNCFSTDAITATNPNGDQCFIYFKASQFDTYSYLFTEPTFISLNDAFTPSGTVIKGMRIGVNGLEPAVGQAYVNIGDTNVGTRIEVAKGYDPVSRTQVLSDVGTILSLEKGAGNDEFFLSFEQFGAEDDNDYHAPEGCGVGTYTCTPPAAVVLAEPAPKVGLRTFEEILASMSVMTGVDPYQTPTVMAAYYNEATDSGVKQQLPSAENAKGFLPAHEMGVAQLAIAYCNALVENGTLRDAFFSPAPAPLFDFNAVVTTAFGAGDSTAKNQIVSALYNNMIGIGGTTLDNMPALAEIKAELIGNPDPTDLEHPGNLYDRMLGICNNDGACTNDAARTRAVVKAMCATTLGSAVMLIQ